MKHTKATLQQALKERTRQVKLLENKLRNAQRTIVILQERAAICDSMFASIEDTQTKIAEALYHAKHVLQEAEIEQAKARWANERAQKEAKS